MKRFKRKSKPKIGCSEARITMKDFAYSPDDLKTEEKEHMIACMQHPLRCVSCGLWIVKQKEMNARIKLKLKDQIARQEAEAKQ